MQVIFALYMLGRGLAWEFVNFCQFFLKNSLFSIPKLKRRKNRWKHVRNHRQNWNRSDTCFRKDVPYNTTHTRESQAQKHKKADGANPRQHNP